MGRPCNSTSSSTDSSASSLSTLKRDLSTDLKLGLSISPSQYETSSRDRCSDWPPIKPLLRSTLAVNGNHRQADTFFVKVYMEGVPIGRKLDLFAHDSYDSLVRTLQRMFGTTILCPESGEMSSNNDNVLAYEDKEGDWMMVGDVPWEMFLTTVKRLKITRENKC